MRSTLARNGSSVTSTAASESDFHRARSEDVGLSSAAKSVTPMSPFHVARMAAPSGTSSDSRPLARNVPSVMTTFTRGSR